MESYNKIAHISVFFFGGGGGLLTRSEWVDPMRGQSNSFKGPILLPVVIRSVTDVLRAQSRFVKFVGGEAAGRTSYTFYKPTLGLKYVSNRPYNEIITPTTFI